MFAPIFLKMKHAMWTGLIYLRTGVNQNYQLSVQMEPRNYNILYPEVIPMNKYCGESTFQPV